MSRPFVVALAQLLEPGGQINARQAEDRDLLRAFVANHSHESFRTLVVRHGPLVWSVCRRILRHWHDAEDAFQAVFLVLARRARHAQTQPVIAHWLHGVASRVARKARGQVLGQRRRDRIGARPEGVEERSEPLWLAQLDEEISRLPDKYRLPLVLCDLAGKTRRSVAGELGWPEGTVAGRLVRARSLLAERLRRHLTAGASAVLAGAPLFAEGAPLPRALTVQTLAAVRSQGAGAAGGVVSGHVLNLVEQEVSSMWIAKVSRGFVLALVVTLTAVGLASGRGWQSDTPPGVSNKGEPEQGAAAQLAGTWRMTHLLQVGKEIQLFEDLRWKVEKDQIKANWTFFGKGRGPQTLRFRIGDKAPGEKAAPANAVTLEFDVEEAKEGDDTPRATTVRRYCLFEITKDSLRIALPFPGGTRPTAVRPARNEEGQIPVLVFERVKPE